MALSAAEIEALRKLEVRYRYCQWRSIVSGSRPIRYGAKLSDDDGGRGGLGPEGPLPDPAQAGVGADPDQRPVADQQSLDGLYLHDASSCVSTDVVSDWSASDSPSSALVGASGSGRWPHSAWK